MIRTTVAYSFHQVTGAGSRGFSGDRALARRKPLDAVAVAIASRMGGRKEHEAKRSVPSPATLPVGETRGFGGKAPECLDRDLGAFEAILRRFIGVLCVGKLQRHRKLNPVGGSCCCFRINSSVGFQEGNNLNSCAYGRVACVSGTNSNIETDGHDQIVAVFICVKFTHEEMIMSLGFGMQERRIRACASVSPFIRQFGHRVTYFGKRLFHKIFQRKHLGAFASGLQLSQWILVQSVSVAIGRAQRNVRGAVFVSRPPLVTGGKIWN